MKRKLLALAAVPMFLTLTAGYDDHYGSSGAGYLSVYLNLGSSASAVAQTIGYTGNESVQVDVSMQMNGSGCPSWRTASN